MEKFVFPIDENVRKPITRSNWKRCLTELNGKLSRNRVHDDSALLLESYSQIGAFPHKYVIDRSACRTYHTHFYSMSMAEVYHAEITSFNQLGVSSLEFDSKGIYLASVTKSGCLTVHEFESLYCHISGEDIRKQILHINLSSGISAVRWNPANQDEVVCTSSSNNEVRIFDIGYNSSEPTEVLRKRPTVSVHTTSVRQGHSDIALLDDNARVLASDSCGTISIWDRRVSDLPQAGLTTNAPSGLTSIQLYGDQCVYGSTKNGFIYVWDLRGGRSSAAFQSHQQFASPLTSVRLSSLMTKIEPLQAQSSILPKEIQSININPSCPYQLGFHLEDGWSGVLDMHNFQVSHAHCPPPPWLVRGVTDPSIPLYSSRKPSWLPEHSIFAVGSTSSNGLHLLDFYPNTSSPCHIDYDDSKSSKETLKCTRNRFVPLSEPVSACAVHPFNGTIVAGTMKASLLMISQKQHSCNEDEDGDNNKDNVNVIDGAAAAAAAAAAAYDDNRIMSIFD